MFALLRGVRLQCHVLGVTSPFLAGKQLLVRGKSTQLAHSKKPTTLSFALALLSTKDAQQAAKDTQLAAKDAQLAALQAAKDTQLAALQAAKDTQLAALQAAKDTQLAALQAAKDAVLSQFHSLSLMSQQDATSLANLQHDADVAAGTLGVRNTLELVIAELWKENAGDGTLGATDRLQQLAKGVKSIPGLRDYVQECAKDNNMSPEKALELLPKMYRELSKPMHASSSDTNRDTPIEAVLNGDRLAMLLVSCMFKLTRRDLRLYRRTHNGGRQSVELNIKEPSCPPALAQKTEGAVTEPRGV
jgi:hypothetical protein